MAIQRIEIRSIILIEAESRDEARAEIESMEPADVVDRCDREDAVGSFVVHEVTTVPESKVGEELIALGCDPDFFGDRGPHDWLVRAGIRFEVNAEDPDAAMREAKCLFDPFMEADDLIGAGEVAWAVRTHDDTWSVHADVRFRIDGDDEDEARASATDRLTGIRDGSDFITAFILQGVSRE